MGDGPHSRICRNLAAQPTKGRVITLADIIDKPEAEMDEQERKALGNLQAFLEERAMEAEEGRVSSRTVQEIFDEVMREEPQPQAHIARRLKDDQP